MRVKTNQVFVKVDMTYTTKNKLEESVLSELRPLDNLLCMDLKEAKQFIKEAIDRGTEACATAKRCKPLRTEYWSHSGSSVLFRANDFIRMSLHPVFIKQ